MFLAGGWGVVSCSACMLNASSGARSSKKNKSGVGFCASGSRFLLCFRADAGMMFSRSDGEGNEGAGGLRKEFKSRSPSVLRVGVAATLSGRGVKVLVRAPDFWDSDFRDSSSATTTESCLEIVAGLRGIRCGRFPDGSPRERSGTMEADKNGSRIKSVSTAATSQIEAVISGDCGLCVLLIRIGDEDL